MVVLEGHNMLGVNSPNQYLQPDYLSPLPTTLDAKKSPLALLVQTCSQIGADSPSTKSLLHPSPLSSADSNSSLTSLSSGGGQKRKASTSSDSGHGSMGASLKSPSDSSNDSRPRSSGSTSSNCSTAKQPRFTNSTSPSGKISPKNYHNNNNIEASAAASVISHGSHSAKIRKLSGQSISSEASERSRSSHAPSRSSPSNSHSASVIVPQGKHSSGSSSSTGTRSPQSSAQHHSHEKSATSKASNNEKTNASPKPSSHQSDQGASPIIRSGLDVLQGKDLPKFGGFGYPPGFDPTNPAFRLPFFAGAHPHLMGFPPTAGPGAPGGGMPPSPYSLAAAAYARKDGMPPVCKDPFCNGCQFSGPGGPGAGAAGSPSAYMAAAAAAAAAAGGPSVCPAGCAQCDHQKFPLIPPSAAGGPYQSIPGFPPGLSHPALGFHPSLLSHPQHAAAAAVMMQHQQAAAAAAAAHQQQNAQRPYVCNWTVADSYCGKRFPSSEELLQHLRTHTNSSAAAAASPSVPTSEGASSIPMSHPGLPPHSVASSLYSNALLNSSVMAAAASMHRAYPTPPLSPHSAARYNPYALAAAVASAASSGKPSGPFPPPPPGLAGYYPSPYSLYGPRIG